LGDSLNHIELKRIQKNKNWVDFEWFIDGKKLCEHLDDRKSVELPKNVAPFDDLCPAWTKELDFRGDVRFVWHLQNLDKAIMPVYMCPDDLDFSCIVIVIEIEKNKDFVYWNRAGYVKNDYYDLQDELRSGIACPEVNSLEWKEWISENWDEELFRRRINYTYPHYLKDENILWFADLGFSFDRYEYEKMVDEYWNSECLICLEKYSKTKMNFIDCIELIKSIHRNGYEVLEKHLADFGEVLLHIYASDEISNPLFELLKNQENEDLIKIYSKVIELMWKYGDEAVVNVVDVTILEKLSDDINVWNRFGKYITNDFKEYIYKQNTNYDNFFTPYNKI
jgi:hypothetical protein